MQTRKNMWMMKWKIEIRLEVRGSVLLSLNREKDILREVKRNKSIIRS